MANPTANNYLQANSHYTWVDGDVYQIAQTDQQEGAALGASFTNLGVDNQPHQILLNKIQWLYNNRITTIPRGLQIYTAAGSGNFTVPAGVSVLFIQAWGPGGTGGYSTYGYSTSGGGGGGGGYFLNVLSVTAGQQLAWIITPNYVQFDQCNATWGQQGGTGAAAFGAGGYPGGVGGRPTLGFNGSYGGQGWSFQQGANTAVVFGQGGTAFGSTQLPITWTIYPETPGQMGQHPGQGGQGGAMGGAGGRGGPGLIVLQW